MENDQQQVELGIDVIFFGSAGISHPEIPFDLVQRLID
jgi:hypothetical protein